MKMKVEVIHIKKTQRCFNIMYTIKEEKITTWNFMQIYFWFLVNGPK